MQFIASPINGFKFLIIATTFLTTAAPTAAGCLYILQLKRLGGVLTSFALKMHGAIMGSASCVSLTLSSGLLLCNEVAI